MYPDSGRTFLSATFSRRLTQRAVNILPTVADDWKIFLLVMFSLLRIQTMGKHFGMECSPEGAARERENTRPVLLKMDSDICSDGEYQNSHTSRRTPFCGDVLPKADPDCRRTLLAVLFSSRRMQTVGEQSCCTAVRKVESDIYSYGEWPWEGPRGSTGTPKVPSGSPLVPLSYLFGTPQGGTKGVAKRYQRGTKGVLEGTL